LTVTPYTASFVNGVPTLSAGTPFDVIGTVLPVSARTLEMLPESARTSASFELFVEGDPVIQTATSGRGGDRLSWHGKSYVVHGTQDYTQHSSGEEVGDDE
jgi:hypothetical protein